MTPVLPQAPPKLSERCETSLSISSSGLDSCRICQCDVSDIDESSPLIAPCLCMGSMKFVHQACLQKWIKSSDKSSCELCKYEYKMTTKTKPFIKVCTSMFEDIKTMFDLKPEYQYKG